MTRQLKQGRVYLTLELEQDTVHLAREGSWYEQKTAISPAHIFLYSHLEPLLPSTQTSLDSHHVMHFLSSVKTVLPAPFQSQRNWEYKYLAPDLQLRQSPENFAVLSSMNEVHQVSLFMCLLSFFDRRHATTQSYTVRLKHCRVFPVLKAWLAFSRNATAFELLRRPTAKSQRVFCSYFNKARQDIFFTRNIYSKF